MPLQPKPCDIFGDCSVYVLHFSYSADFHWRLLSRFWSRLYDDLLAKGAQTGILAPKVQEYCKSLADRPTAHVLQCVVEEVGSLKASMRHGAVADLEKVLYKRLVETARNILAGEAVGFDVGLSILETILTGLRYFKDTAGVLQLVQKVEQFKKKELKNLSGLEIKLQLDKYPTDRTSDFPSEFEHDGFEPVLLKLAPMADQLDHFSVEIQSKMKTAIFWHFRFLHSSLKAAHVYLPAHQFSIQPAAYESNNAVSRI